MSLHPPQTLDTRGLLTAGRLDLLRPSTLLSAPGTTFTLHLGFRTPQTLRRMAEGPVGCVERSYADDPIRAVN